MERKQSQKTLGIRTNSASGDVDMEDEEGKAERLAPGFRDGPFPG